MELTRPDLFLSGWYDDFMSKRSDGMGDQADFPSLQSSHSLDALSASPPNLQLRPTMAIG